MLFKVKMHFTLSWHLTLDSTSQEVFRILCILVKIAMPRDILVAKFNAYGMSQETVTLFAGYFRNWKQRVKIGNCESDWEPLSKGVPQGSIMGFILFNLFLNDIALFIKHSSLTNYADDNTLIDFANLANSVLSTVIWRSDWSPKSA